MDETHYYPAQIARAIVALPLIYDDIVRQLTLEGLDVAKITDAFRSVDQQHFQSLPFHGHTASLIAASYRS